MFSQLVCTLLGVRSPRPRLVGLSRAEPPDPDSTVRGPNLIQPTVSLPLAVETKSPPKSETTAEAHTRP